MEKGDKTLYQQLIDSLDDGDGLPKAMQVTRLGELVHEPTRKVNFIWDRTLPVGGLSILAAKPKIGKSTLVRNLALAVARGQVFLGRATVQVSVLYLALEEQREQVATHFTNLEAEDEPVFVSTDRAPADSLGELEKHIRVNEAKLAIVDPLFRFLRISDANDYASVSSALEPLMALAKGTDCHIMLVHHMGKAERGHGDQILGSTALFAAVDTALLMREKEGFRVISSIQRYGHNFEETILTMDEPTRSIYVVEGGLELSDTALRERILKALSDGPMTAAQLMRTLHMRRNDLYRLLTEMVANGNLDREKRPRGQGGALFRKSIPTLLP